MSNFPTTYNKEVYRPTYKLMNIEKSANTDIRDQLAKDAHSKVSHAEQFKTSSKVSSSDLRKVIKSPEHFIFMFAVER